MVIASLNRSGILNNSYNGINSAVGGDLKNGQSDTDLETETTGKTTGKTTEKILGLMKENAGITIKEIAAACGITDDGVYYQLKRMKQAGLIKRVGSRKNGYWMVVSHT